VAVAAAVAHGAEAGNGLEVVGAVAGGNRLARELRARLPGEGGRRRGGRHHHGVEVDGAQDVAFGGHALVGADGSGEQEGGGDGQAEGGRTDRRAAGDRHGRAPWENGDRD